MKCTNCSTDQGDLVFKFCPTCGATQSPSCTSCGAKLPNEARFCPECGTSSSKGMTAAAAPNIAIPPPVRVTQAQISPASVAAATEPKATANMIGRFAKFWAKAVEGPFVCWKFSDSSLTEAQSLANERVATIARKFRTEGLAPNHYLYSDQRLREPVVEEVGNAVISRNAYGCLVLNTANVMFIDVDFEVTRRNPSTGKPLYPSVEERFPELSVGAGLLGIFKDRNQALQDAIIKKLEDWTATRPGWGWRVYRTYAGLRLLATHDLFDPEAAETYDIFAQLYADPLYTKLCKVQRCFRARLTPKPWRCGYAALGETWPWSSEKAEQAFKTWEQTYKQKSSKYSSCILLATVGNKTLHPLVSPIVSVHDEIAGVGSGLKLA